MPRLGPADSPITLPVAYLFERTSFRPGDILENNLKMMSYRAIYNCLVDTRLRNKERCQFISRSKHVAKSFLVVGCSNTVITHPILIKAPVKDFDSPCKKTSLGSKQIIFMEDAFLESESVLLQERPLIQSKHYAHECKITAQERILIIVIHSRLIDPFFQLISRKESILEFMITPS